MLPEIIIWTIVFVVGVPSAWRNPTAAALVISWIFGELAYIFTGDNLPINFYLYPDIFTLAVIMAKPEACNLRPYQSTLHQLKCLLLERSPSDRMVMLIFPLMWTIYVSGLHPYYVWWLLWSLVILQFLFASAESIEKFWRSRGQPNPPPVSDDVSRFAEARGYG